MNLQVPEGIHDREAEWASLAGFVGDERPGSTLGLVYGRRRQGKTFLLEPLAQASGGFYHMALEQEASLALSALGADLGRRLGAPAPIALPGWTGAIDALLRLGEGDRSVPIVLDEFPYLVAASPELPSTIQRALGPTSDLAQRSRARLILCGSALSVMTQLLSGTAPLRGRAGMDLLIQPFGYREMASFWGIDDPALAVRLHAVLGGTPAYRGLLRDDAPTTLEDFDGWVLRAVLDPASALFREGRYLLAEEPGISDRALYHSILTAIAEGQTRPGQIAAILARPPTALAHPLAVLEDVRLVRRADDVLRQRRPTYRIAEPILRFYHAVMRPHMPRLEMGRAADVWPAETRSTFSSRVLGPHFEELARTWTASFASADTLGGAVGEVGTTVLSDPAGRAMHEVDVVALSPSSTRRRTRIVALGEARWRTEPVGEGELERLRRIRDILAARDDVTTGDATLLLFSAAGFTPGVEHRAAKGNVELVSLDRLYQGD
jgi:AAA+ ATPase superfamily predicted ATPase